MTKINKTSFVAYFKKKNFLGLTVFLYFQRLMPDTHILEHKWAFLKVPMTFTYRVAIFTQIDVKKALQKNFVSTITS